MMTGATGPCWARPCTASKAIVVRGVAPLTTEQKGFCACSVISTTTLTARRSCGLGLAGMSTRVRDRDRRADDVDEGRRGINDHQAHTLPLEGAYVLGLYGEMGAKGGFGCAAL